jgi:hypothetical protein
MMNNDTMHQKQGEGQHQEQQQQPHQLLEDIDLVKSQTGELDIEIIKKTLNLCNGNVLDAVCMLLKVPQHTTRQDQQPVKFEDMTKFQQLREIMNEKDIIFHQVMEQARKEAES